MNGNLKKLLSILVVLAMVLGMVPVVGVPAVTAKADAVVTEGEQATPVPGSANLPEGIQEEIERAAAIAAYNPAEVIAGTTCPMCGAENVTWAPAAIGTGVHNGTAKHYYLSGVQDFTETAGYYLFNSTGDGSKICVVLDNANVTTNSLIRTQKGSNITLNFMGNGTITATGSSCEDLGLILAQATDSTINLYGGTYIYTGASKAGTYPAIQAQVGSDINIYNDTIIGKATQDRTTANYNVRVTGAGSTLNMYGGTIRNGVTGVAAISGNVHLATNASLNMYGGTITGGTSILNGTTVLANTGGNIYNGGNAVNIYGGTISGGFAGSMGGNIYSMSSTGSVNISGGTITGGASANGGNITMYRNALNVSGTALIENGKGSKDGTTINGSAGNVCLSSGNAAVYLNMTGGTIRGGQASIGGNIYAQTNANANGAEAFNISGGTITGGSASTVNGRGGNINTVRPGTIGANAVISDGTALRGGNIYMEAGGSLTTSGTITGGTALMSGTLAGYGGNIVAAENLTVTGGTIANGKVQAAEGVTLTTSCLGGNIYNNGKTLTISGGYIYGGEVVDATDENVLHSGNIYSSGPMNISGGVIAGDTRMLSTAALTLSGSPVIDTTITLADGTQKTAVGGCGIQLPSRVYVDVSALKSDADIAIYDSGAAFLVANDNNQNLVGVFHNVEGTKYSVVRDSDGMMILEVDRSFNPDRETNYCEVCKELVTWETAPTTAPAEPLPAGSHVHYYVPEDMTFEDGNLGMFQVEVKNSTGTDRVQICLYLNGKTLTVPVYVYNGSGAIVNIIGEGTVNNLLGDTCTFNLYGGTYTDGTVLFSTGGCKVIAYEDADIKSTVKLNKGTLTLNDSASVEDLVVSGTGKLVLAEGWSGTVNATVDAALIADGKVAATAVDASAAFTGTITVNGILTKVEGGQLVLDTTFDPESETNYCRICGETVAWQPVPTTAPAEPLPAGSHVHYYVPEDMTYADEEGLFFTEVKNSSGTARVQICLYLNGKTLTVPAYVYNGSGAIVNIIGEGTVNNLLGDTCTFNLYGGTYTGGTVLFSTAGCNVIAYEDAEIKSTVKLNKGTLTLKDSASVEDLVVSGTGKLVIAEGWSGTVNATVDAALIADDKVAATAVDASAAFTGTITVNGIAAVVENGQLVINTTFNPENELNYCRICKEMVAWEVVPTEDATAAAAQNSHWHYYLPEDTTYAGTKGLFQGFMAKGVTICLYLNNKTLTVPTYVYNGSGAIVNIIGEGTVNNLLGDTCTFNLYGGTYTGGTVLFSTAGCKVIAYEDAEIKSTVKLNKGTLTLNDSASVEDLVVSGTGKLVIAEGWTGSVAANFDAALMDNGKVVSTAVTLPANLTGSVTVNGLAATVENGQLTVTYPPADVFAPWDYAGCAYCNHCQDYAIWTDYNKEVEALGYFYDSAHLLSLTGVQNLHYYLSEDVVYDTGFFVTYENLCFNLNGHNVTAGQAYSAQAFSSSYRLALMNTAETTATVVGGGTSEKISRGAAIHVNGANASGSAYLYDNIVLTKRADAINDPIVGVMTGGGAFYMMGGTIDGTGLENTTAYPVCVNIGGSSGDTQKSRFYLYGGEIKGGTSEFGDCVSISKYAAEAIISGGTITGGTSIFNSNVKLVGAMNIGEVILGQNAMIDISELTEGANIEVIDVAPNRPVTAACENFDAVKDYIHFVNNENVLISNNQYLVDGLAIFRGEEFTEYATVDAAIADYKPEDFANGAYIRAGLEDIVLAGGDYLVDIAGNGNNGTLSISGTGNLSVFDSANADFDGGRNFTVSEGINLDTDVTVTKDEEDLRFVIITEPDGSYSAHHLAMAVDSVNLNMEKVGLSYGATYQCDDVLAGMISSYGIVVSVNDMPGTKWSSTDKCTEHFEFVPVKHTVTSESNYVTNIFSDSRTAEKNAQFGQMKIYANAYIKIDLNGDGVLEVLVADTENAGKKEGVAWSLLDAMVYIDENWSDYAAEQEAIEAFYDTWYDKGMSSYSDAFKNIDAPADVEEGGAEGEDTDMDVPV